MNEPRIIKESVRRALKDVVAKNKQRYVADDHARYTPPPHAPSPYYMWSNERMHYPITTPNGSQFVVEIRGENIVTDLSLLPEDCYDAVLSMPEVFDSIVKERKHQDDKWGPNKPQSLPGFLIILERELQEAKDAWLKNVEGEHAALNEIVQIAATAVACLEKYGVTGSAIATNDIPVG